MRVLIEASFWNEKVHLLKNVLYFSKNRLLKISSNFNFSIFSKLSLFIFLPINCKPNKRKKNSRRILT